MFVISWARPRCQPLDQKTCATCPHYQDASSGNHALRRPRRAYWATACSRTSAFRCARGRRGALPVRARWRRSRRRAMSSSGVDALAVRIGIATGIVSAGDLPPKARPRARVVGETRIWPPGCRPWRRPRGRRQRQYARPGRAPLRVSRPRPAAAEGLRGALRRLHRSPARPVRQPLRGAPAEPSAAMAAETTS